MPLETPSARGLRKSKQRHGSSALGGFDEANEGTSGNPEIVHFIDGGVFSSVGSRAMKRRGTNASGKFEVKYEFCPRVARMTGPILESSSRRDPSKGSSPSRYSLQ